MLWIGAIFGALFGWVGILVAAHFWATLAILKLLWALTLFTAQLIIGVSALLNASQALAKQQDFLINQQPRCREAGATAEFNPAAVLHQVGPVAARIAHQLNPAAAMEPTRRNTGMGHAMGRGASTAPQNTSASKRRAWSKAKGSTDTHAGGGRSQPRR